MPKQKRYRSEKQIIAMIDRAHALEADNVAEIAKYQAEIAEARKYDNQGQAINYRKMQIETLEKRIKRRATRLVRLKAKLAEFRTIVLPGMSELMTDESIAR
jgi:hypothetical protein